MNLLVELEDKIERTGKETVFLENHMYTGSLVEWVLVRSKISYIAFIWL